MANPKHIEILKQGVEVWNKWREENPNTQPDLSIADLSGAMLREVYLADANLYGAMLVDANLYEADLRDAILLDAHLSGADLRKANLMAAALPGAKLIRSDLSGANLVYVRLDTADLRGANLAGADLGTAYLFLTNLEAANLQAASLKMCSLLMANLHKANLTETRIGFTSFGDVDLRSIRGLETVRHENLSYVDIHTLIRSQGQIPEAFLKGTGTPDVFIEYIRSLVIKPIEYYSCFISYSSKDDAFAKRLHADLQSHNVRCWFAPEDMKIGDRIRPRIDESIRIYDKLLLVLSEHSVSSKWVEFEVEAAMDKEQEGKTPVLFPVRLDNTVMDSTTAWAAHIKRTRNMGDFTRWKNHDDYQKAFERLLRDLKASS